MTLVTFWLPVSNGNAVKPKCILQADATHRSEIVALPVVGAEILKHTGTEFSAEAIQLQVYQKYEIMCVWQF